MVRYDDENVYVEIKSHGTPSLDGFGCIVEFDTDQDPLTGMTPIQNWNPFFEELDMGVDKYIIMFDCDVSSNDQTIVGFGLDRYRLTTPRSFFEDPDGVMGVTFSSLDDSAEYIFLSRPMDDVIRGDVNCDGMLNLFDVQPFVESLQNGTIHPAADCNQDGNVDLFDVPAFIELLAIQ